jgi:hypothetical protein
MSGLRVLSDGNLMTAYDYHKPVLSWSRHTKEILHPITQEPIMSGNMLDFTTIIENGRNK